MPKPGESRPALVRGMVPMSAPLKAGLRELQERAGAVGERAALRRHPVLLLARHFAERACEAVGLKHRIVAEPTLPTRRPNQDAVDPGLEFLDVAVRPGETQSRDEMRAAVGVAHRAFCPQQVLDLAHCGGEISVGSGPARGMNARRAA